MTQRKLTFLSNILGITTFIATIAGFNNSMHAQTFTDSNLPIVIINTDGAAYIPDDPKILANMKIIYNGPGKRNSLADINNPNALNYDGRIGISVRGSSSQLVEKKQYSLETRLADNNTNNNVSLLGMPAENDWVLNGLAFEPSYLRDYMCYNLSRALGYYAPRTQYCEVVINGNYRGLYVLQEKIKVDANRVDIAKIAKTDITLPQLSGGYITKADKIAGKDIPSWTMSSYVGTNDVSYIHDTPKPADIATQQNNYIYSQFTLLESKSSSPSVTTGYPSIIDIPSFINFILLNELSANVDAYQFSTFFHKDRNGKLRAGPLWDSNLTFGNDLTFWGYDRSKTNTWQFYNGDNIGSKFWKDLFSEPTFRCYLSKRWNELTQPGQPLNATSINTLIDTTLVKISEASAREKVRWSASWSAWWPTPINYNTHIVSLKNFINNRISWMTASLGSYSSCSNVQVPPLVISKINYNPQTTAQFSDSNDQEFIEIVNNGNNAVDLTGFYFQGTGLVYQFPSITIGARAVIQLASKKEVFKQRYGTNAFDEYTRHLANEGQKIILSDAFGNIIDQVDYSSTAPWPDAAANGKYLKLKDLALDNALPSSWTAAAESVVTATENTSTSLDYFPNPVEKILEIRCDELIRTIQIQDTQGRILQTLSSNESSRSIDMSMFTNGLYIITIATSKGMSYIKVLKQ